MISEDFIKQCSGRVWHEPIALKLYVPYWMTVTKQIDIKYLRKMTLHDDVWMFFVLPKKTPEKELRDLLSVISPYCTGDYFVL